MLGKALASSYIVSKLLFRVSRDSFIHLLRYDTSPKVIKPKLPAENLANLQEMLPKMTLSSPLSSSRKSNTMPRRHTIRLLTRSL